MQYISSERRGVSPVISVILMVAISVVLASLIGFTALKMEESSLSENSRGSVDFTVINDSAVNITLTNVRKLDGLIVKGECSVPQKNISVGESVTATDCYRGDKIKIIGRYEGANTLLQEYEVR